MVIAFINDLGTHGVNVASLDNSYTPTSGNLVIVVSGTWNGTSSANAVATLTDTRGNTIPSPTVDLQAGKSALRIWLIPNCIGGAGTFTLTPAGGNSDINCDVYEYSGATAAGTLDGTPATNVGNTPSLSSGNITTSFAGSLLFSAAFNQSAGTTATHTLGGTQRINNQNPDGATSDEMDLIANAGTYSDTITFAAGGAFEIGLIGIKAGVAAFSRPNLGGPLSTVI